MSFFTIVLALHGIVLICDCILIWRVMTAKPVEVTAEWVEGYSAGQYAGGERGRLRGLAADFRKLCAALKYSLLLSNSDRPGLALTIVRRQLAFSACYAGARARVFLRRAD